MLSGSHKSKQYLLVALKVLILVGAFWYVGVKLANTDSKAFAVLGFSLLHKSTASILLIIGLSISNWCFEILKWKTIIASVKKLSFSEAAKQSLTALTTSLATPNRIGDYGVKAYFYSAEKRKKVLLLNFFSNSAQMLVTSFFGVIGLIYLIKRYGISFSKPKMLLLLFGLLALGFLGYIFKERQLVLKGLSIANVLKAIKRIHLNIKLKVILYSLVRYLIFSYLFYYLLVFFGAKLQYSEAILFIYAMYLFVSIIPTIFMFDVVVRSGVAVWLFSIAGIEELIILSTVLTMWLLNFVIPATIGSIYIVGHKPSDQ